MIIGMESYLLSGQQVLFIDPLPYCPLLALIWHIGSTQWQEIGGRSGQESINPSLQYVQETDFVKNHVSLNKYFSN